MKMKPYKASRCKGMPHNRGTGRLKTFRDEANRAVRIQSRQLMREILHAERRGDENRVDDLLQHINDHIGMGYWD